jgi:mannose-6-phosphate isomerase-like protein (cupin superfamily)
MRLLPVFLFIGFSACATGGANVAARQSGVVITPEGNISEPAWSEGELAQQVSIRNMRRTDEASFHLMRVQGSEPDPYVHEHSDLVLMVVSGKLELALGREKITVASGDVVEIPRGTPMQTANAGGADASVAYMVFTPALQAGDRTKLTESPRESSWKWTLWPQ